MKNKLNVFAAVFCATCLGAELQDHSFLGASIDTVLVILNLWLAGFFEDSPCN